MNSWYIDLLKKEKDKIDLDLARKKSLKMHSKFIIQIYHEHYLLRKSINKSANFCILSKPDLKYILKSDLRTKDLFTLNNKSYDTYVECKKFDVEYSFDSLYRFTNDHITSYFLSKLFIKNNLIAIKLFFIFIIAILTAILNVIGFM